VASLIGQPYVASSAKQSWHLAHCKNAECGRCTLVLVDGDERGFAQFDAMAKHAISLFPAPAPTYAQPAVPKEIATEFTEALRCQAAGFFIGAALVGRRVLQSAIRERSGTGRNLQEEIDSLPKLSEAYKAHAHQVRLIGNDAAHAGTITEEDVVDLIDFTDLILAELYVNPARLAAAQQRRPSK